MIDKIKTIHVLWFFMILVLSLSSCQESTVEENSLEIEMHSVFEFSSVASDMAKNWQQDAELMLVQVTYDEIFDKIVEDYVKYKFASYQYTDETFVVKCEDEECGSYTYQNEVLGEHAKTALELGLSPVSLEEVQIDSNEAVAIANQTMPLDTDGDTVRISLVLVRDLDTKTLLWSITNVTREPDGSINYISIMIDSITGKVIDIDE